MTYLYTRHAEKPKPVVITEDEAYWFVSTVSSSARRVWIQISQLELGEVDHIDVRDGTITVEKGSNESV